MGVGLQLGKSIVRFLCSFVASITNSPLHALPSNSKQFRQNVGLRKRSNAHS